MPAVTYLHDDLVSLAPLEDEDAEQLQHWINDQGTLYYLGFPGGLSLAQEREWLTHVRHSSTDCVLGISRKDNGQLIGVVGLHGMSRIESHAEFGIQIGEDSARGLGLGTAAGRLLVDHGFNRLNLQRIMLYVFDYNQRGRKSYEKIGFKLEGELRQHVFRDGAYHNVHVMGLLRDEFNERWADWREEQRRRYNITD